jgi:hypothetical protein
MRTEDDAADAQQGCAVLRDYLLERLLHVHPMEDVLIVANVIFAVRTGVPY